MPGLFHSLNTAYTGLKTTQTGIHTVSHNISNADTEGYTRQRAIQRATAPLTDVKPGDLGTGVEVSQIARVKDSFIYAKLKYASEDKENLDVLQENLIRISNLFPDIENIGLKRDINAYFTTWSRLAQNPANSSIKIDLAGKAKSLTSSIRTLYDKINDVRINADSRIATTIKEVNTITEKIAELNKEIYSNESNKISHANDLRDKRDLLELKLSKLMHIVVSTGSVERDSMVDRQVEKREGFYNINFNGIGIVDDLSSRKIYATKDKNRLGMNDLYYLDDNFHRVPIEENITGGRLGALITLRGIGYDEDRNDVKNGMITEVLNNLNDFSKTLIERTNSIYSQSLTDRMITNSLKIDERFPVTSQKKFGIKEGSFNVTMYNATGEKILNRTINIDDKTSLNGDKNSIMAQLKLKKDDTKDNISLNDFNDYFDVFLGKNHKVNILIKDKYKGEGLKLSLNNDTSNFLGYAGFNRFFDGSSAKDISLKREYREEPLSINGNVMDKKGDNKIANDMVALQYINSSYMFNGEKFDSNILNFYDMTSTKLATDTEGIVTSKDTAEARLNSIEEEYNSISGVNVDEELTRLMRYQTAYSASAKVVSAVDKMLDTLLGMSH